MKKLFDRFTKNKKKSVRQTEGKEETNTPLNSSGKENEACESKSSASTNTSRMDKGTWKNLLQKFKRKKKRTAQTQNEGKPAPSKSGKNTNPAIKGHSNALHTNEKNRSRSNPPAKKLSKPRHVYSDSSSKSSSSRSSRSHSTKSSEKRSKSKKDKSAKNVQLKRPIAEEKTKKDASQKIRHEDTKSDKDWKAKYPPVLTNNMNNGILLMKDGRPFWHRTVLNANGEYDEDEESDEDLPMNDNILQDVYKGRLKLAEMPRIIVHLSPYGPLDQLKKNINELCTRDILMGNTVRSMLLLCDEQSDGHSRGKKNANKKEQTNGTNVQKRKTLTFLEPTHVTLYDRGHPSKPTRIVELKELQPNVDEDSE